MTPMWRGAIKPLLGRLTEPTLIRRREILARARCFDMREVQRLVWETSVELREASNFNPSDGETTRAEFSVDIGEKVCFPAPISWIELNDAAVLLDTAEDPSFAIAMGILVRRDAAGAPHPETGIIGGLLLQDGIATVARLNDLPTTHRLLPHKLIGRDEGTFMVYMALAAVALIGSPAAEGQPQPPHRGMERDVARCVPLGLPEVRHTVVTLGRLNQSGSGRARTYHKKAYHFVRAHPRRNGQLVRAHWRGDPAFGVRLPSYRMTAPTESATKAA